MRKGGTSVEKDFFQALKSSQLKTMITGKIYYSGTRPMDSSSEDAVISFLTGDMDQIQTGFVNVNVFVPNVDIGGNSGVKVRNVARCEQLEIALTEWIESISLLGEYKIKADSPPQSKPVDSIDQHYINCKLNFSRTTFN